MGKIKVARNTGMALFAAVLLIVASVPESRGERSSVKVDAATNLEIILQLDSADVGVAEVGSWVPIYLTNIFQDVGGFEVTLLLNRPDLFKFPADSSIETTIVCIDTLDCDPADTTIDTVSAGSVDTVGTAISGWDFVEGRSLSDINMKVVTLANQAGSSVPPLTPTGTPRLLCNVFLEKVASSELLDTLQDRTAQIFIIESQTSFSTPNGTTIGRADSTIVLNPPRLDTIITGACDTLPFDTTCDTSTVLSTLDTIFYTDTAAFSFFDGTRVFVGNCVNGDVNESGTINASDIIYLVNHVFKGGPPATCSPLAGDVNCSGTVNASDIIYLVNFVFKAGPPPGSC